MADVIYNFFKTEHAKANIDLDGDTIKCMLLSGHTPDKDADDYIDDASGDEISGTGYTAGGATLSNKSVTQDNTNDLAYWDADDVSWPNSTISADGAILYKDTGTPSTSPMICYIDLGGTQSTVAATFTIQWNASGIMALQETT